MGVIYILCLLIGFAPQYTFSEDKTPTPSLKSDIQYPDSDFFTKHYREHFLEKDEFYGKSEMNGIPFNDYLTNFENLKLITIRYREDNNELRMVYGNELAIKGIRNPEHKFESGATIYKLAYPSISDPAFVSSKSPGHGYIRYQVMKYDPKKYRTGWGYAIFGYDGKTFPGNPTDTMETCIACHDLVKDRNYVFSVMMENPDPRKVVSGDKEIFKNIFSVEPVFKNPERLKGTKIKGEGQNILFEIADFSKIPERVRMFIQQKSSKVNKLSGNLMKKPFVAFLPEVVPLLIDKTLKNHYPSYGVVDKRRTFFVFTYIGAPDKNCSKEKINLFYGVGYYRLEGASNLLLNKKCFTKTDRESLKTN